MPKQTKTKTLAKPTTATAKAAGISRAPSTVSVHEVYALDEFKRRTGLDKAAIRQARRKGLKVVKVGRRSFVIGQDFATYLAQSTDALDGLTTPATDLKSFAASEI